MRKFERIQRNYFTSTGNSGKGATLKLMQQITLMLRVAAFPNAFREYDGATHPAVEMAAQWGDEIGAVGVLHQSVLDAYAAAFHEYLSGRPLFTVPVPPKSIIPLTREKVCL